MLSAQSPHFTTLTPEECRALLSSQRVGRIAYSFHHVVEIEPIHFLYSDGWIFGRTSKGAKLQMLLHQPWVAFEVDEVVGELDWQSVVVRGTFTQLSDTGSPTHRAMFARAVAAIQHANPTAFTADDPTPHREIVFGIVLHEVTGRRAISG